MDHVLTRSPSPGAHSRGRYLRRHLGRHLGRHSAGTSVDVDTLPDTSAGTLPVAPAFAPASYGGPEEVVTVEVSRGSGARTPWWYRTPNAVPTDVLHWLDINLLAQGRTRLGPVQVTHVRAWSMVARVETDAGVAHLKGTSPGTAHEIDVLRVLSREAPGHVVEPWAADRERGLLLIPDGGSLLGDMEGAHSGRGKPLGFHVSTFDVPTSRPPPTVAVADDQRPAWALGLARGLASMARLQRATSHTVDELLAAGVPDMRPEVLLDRFDEALDAAASRAGRARSPWLDDVVAQITAIRPQVADECAELAGLALRPAIDHDDLHPWNLLRPARPGRAPLPIDWGDSVVTHPFVVLLVPLRARRRRDDREQGVLELRRTYLSQWREDAPMFELSRAADLACRLGSIVRAHSWLRILEATDQARGSVLREGSAGGTNRRPGSIHAGSIHAGSIHAGSVNGGSVNGGSVNGGLVNAGSVSTGSVRVGATNVGSDGAGGVSSGDLVPLLWLRNLVLPSYLGALTAQGRH